MTRFLTSKLVLVFAVVFSLASLSASTSSVLVFPSFPPAHALAQPCETHGSTGACSEFWYPAGPSMDTLAVNIFADSTAEYLCILSALPCLDFPDVPASLAVASVCSTSPTLYVTAPISGNQFCYPSGWTRVINDAPVGLPNDFTWLNARNPAPSVPGTIRQGLSQAVRSLSPYVASTASDLLILGNVYDSLHTTNPLSPSQTLDWMTISTFQLSNSSLTYTSPAHTLVTFRFTLRPDLFFQDGSPVTSYDAAFSYLSLVGTGAFLGAGATTMTGVTVLGSRQFDIAVDSVPISVLANLASVPILPGRYWSSAGGAVWDSATRSCTGATSCSFSQYTLSGRNVNCSMNCATFTPGILTVDPFKAAATFDPIASHVFIGSGPWECGPATSSGSGVCSSSGTMSPPVGGSFTLTRFGAGLPPASSVNGVYFRSSGNLALCIWATGCTFDPTIQSPITVFSQIAACYGQPVNLIGPCGHWQQGIGNFGTGNTVGLGQVSIVLRFIGLNWVLPYNWHTSPPTGIAAVPPILYEGSATLNPASVAGCTSPYPTGGYDC